MGDGVRTLGFGSSSATTACALGRPILGMQSPSTAYLDAHNLAAILKVTPATILRRVRSKPRTLPAPAYLGPRFPLRWRRTDVDAWLDVRRGSA